MCLSGDKRNAVIIRFYGRLNEECRMVGVRYLILFSSFRNYKDAGRTRE
jgi:hypothetical protein